MWSNPIDMRVWGGLCMGTDFVKQQKNCLMF